MPADEPPELDALNLSRVGADGIHVESLSLQVAEALALDTGDAHVLVTFREETGVTYPFLIPLSMVRQLADQMVEFAEKVERHLGEGGGDGGHAN
jgi:hypothetical protein